MFNSNNHYTTKIFYIPLFICVIIFFILNIIGVSIYSTKNIDYKNNVSRRLSKERTLDQCNCCCCNCQCNNNNSNNQSQNQNGGSSGNTQNNNPNNSDSQDKSDDIDNNKSDNQDNSGNNINDSDKNDNSNLQNKSNDIDQNKSDNQNSNSGENINDSDKNDNSNLQNKSNDIVQNKSDNQNNSGENINDSDKNDNSDHINIPGNNDNNQNENGTENSDGNTQKNEEEKNNNIIRLKDTEFGLSFSLFSFSTIFSILLFCFIIRYISGFTGLCFTCHLICLSIPLSIYFILDIILISIRISCNESYKLLYGNDKFIKKNKGLLFLNFFQLFILLLIYFFLILIIFCEYEKICQAFKECLTFLCCCFYCECSCDKIKQFCKDICEKENNNNNSGNMSSISETITENQTEVNIINNNDDVNPYFINKELDCSSSDSFRKQKKNPVGPNSEMYSQKCLLRQKILIVMTYYGEKFNIDKLNENGNNKTVKEAVKHYGIIIIPVRTYENAIKELTKNEKGKCPYYACWLINSNNEVSEDAENFLNILLKFWKNGGAVVLFSDNEPFIYETNRFLSMINAGFTMEGNYLGKKLIYGDDTGKLLSPGLFNRKEEDYTFGKIKRQKLSHNLHEIYEGVTISSVTKNGKRKLNVKNDDIKPFIPFARDSEGGITSLIRLASNNGEGDIIIDGGFTKLFLNMEEEGTFRYIQNIAGFTARPEIHYENGINPKDYRPKYVKK